MTVKASVNLEAAHKLPKNIFFGASSWNYPGWCGLGFSGAEIPGDNLRSARYSFDPFSPGHRGQLLSRRVGGAGRHDFLPDGWRDEALGKAVAADLPIGS